MNGNNPNPIEVLNYNDSIEKLQGITERVNGGAGEINLSESLPFFCFLAALKAQLKVLKYLNDEYLNCALAWDARTGLPSHPSIIADVGSYIKHFEPKGVLGIVLRSFLGWTLFSAENLMCACGRGFSLRQIKIDVMLNHAVRVEADNLVIKQFLGIKCDDPGHLKHHYDVTKLSQRDNDLHLIWTCENQVELKDGLEIKSVKTLQSKQFNAGEFENRILELKSLPDITSP